jgi:hypothetical protein
MIGGVKGTNVWFSDSDRPAVRPFPGMQNIAWRSDLARRQVIHFVESVLRIAVWTIWIAGLIAPVADARKSVARGNFGLFAVVIAVREFPVSLSSEIIRSVPIFLECSEFLRTGTYSTPPPGCHVIAAQNTIMGLWKLLQGQYERQ